MTSAKSRDAAVKGSRHSDFMSWLRDVMATSTWTMTRVVTSCLTTASNVAAYRLSNAPVSRDHAPRSRDSRSARSTTTCTVPTHHLANAEDSSLIFARRRSQSVLSEEINRVVSVHQVSLANSSDTRAPPHRRKMATPWRRFPLLWCRLATARWRPTNRRQRSRTQQTLHLHPNVYSENTVPGN